MKAKAKTGKRKPRLTAVQEKFVSEYLVDLNATRAYLHAFPGSSYNAARAHASRLVANGNVKTEITRALRAVRKASRLSAERVLREVCLIAFSDIADVFDLSVKEWVLLPPGEIDP